VGFVLVLLLVLVLVLESGRVGKWESEWVKAEINFNR